jgi:hypothetical protein
LNRSRPLAKRLLAQSSSMRQMEVAFNKTSWLTVRPAWRAFWGFLDATRATAKGLTWVRVHSRLARRVELFLRARPSCPLRPRRKPARRIPSVPRLIRSARFGSEAQIQTDPLPRCRRSGQEMASLVKAAQTPQCSLPGASAVAGRANLHFLRGLSLDTQDRPCRYSFATTMSIRPSRP